MADDRTTGTARVKRGLAEMLRGGVIMDVTNPEQAKIAQDAGITKAAAGRAIESLIDGIGRSLKKGERAALVVGECLRLPVRVKDTDEAVQLIVAARRNAPRRVGNRSTAPVTTVRVYTPRAYKSRPPMQLFQP